jgi:flagellar protein FliO/FliZ
MFETLFGSGMPLPARFFIAFVVVLGLIGVAAWLIRRFGASRFGTAGIRGRQPRLAVIDVAIVDSRRRLVLIRRDNLEHLLMIGGPTDVVVEPNIVRATPARETGARNMPVENGWPLQPFGEPVQPAAQRGYTREVAQNNARTMPSVADPAGDRTNMVENDHHLSDMASQLEASLRRKPKLGSRPPVGESLAAYRDKTNEPALRAPREFKPSFEPKNEPDTESPFEPKFNVRPEPKLERGIGPNSEAAADMVTNTESSFGAEPMAATRNDYYDNLEEEMASLLGRPKR